MTIKPEPISLTDLGNVPATYSHEWRQAEPRRRWCCRTPSSSGITCGAGRR